MFAVSFLIIRQVITIKGITKMFINNQFNNQYNLQDRNRLRSRLPSNKDEIYLDETLFVYVKLVQGRLDSW